jgi:hypothetical protein
LAVEEESAPAVTTKPSGRSDERSNAAGNDAIARASSGELPDEVVQFGCEVPDGRRQSGDVGVVVVGQPVRFHPRSLTFQTARHQHPEKPTAHRLPSPCIPGIYIAVTRNHTEYVRTR